MLRLGGISRRERLLLVGILVLGLAVRLAYVLATHGHHLVGDEVEYDAEARAIVAGHWFWSLAPTGELHPGMFKTPIYPMFIAGFYKLLGSHYDRVLLVQTLIGVVTIYLTFILGRRLFGTRAALAAAALVAVCPFAWQFDVRLFAESIATPLSLLFLILLLDREHTLRSALGLGLVAGLIILTRPSGIYLVPVLAVALVIAAGVRRGAVLTGIALVVAALVMSPWLIRNHNVSGAWVLSLQDVAPYGTFNDDAANDKDKPYAWRVYNRRDAPILAHARQLGDAEFRTRLHDNYMRYIKDHPASLIKAFYWNGLTRLWDVRRPRHVLDEVRFTGRSRTLTAIGLAIYWVCLALAIVGLWIARHRRAVVVPLLVMAASASVVFTADAETRYRAPFEPIIALLACSAAVALLHAWRARRAGTAAAVSEPRVAQPIG